MRLRNIPGANEAVAASPYCIQNAAEHRGQWHAFFENDHPIHIEIGMGKGRFLMDLAALHPEINYIGIERYTSVHQKSAFTHADFDMDRMVIFCVKTPQNFRKFLHRKKLTGSI